MTVNRTFTLSGKYHSGHEYFERLGSEQELLQVLHDIISGECIDYNTLRLEVEDDG